MIISSARLFTKETRSIGIVTCVNERLKRNRRTNKKSFKLRLNRRKKKKFIRQRLIERRNKGFVKLRQKKSTMELEFDRFDLFYAENSTKVKKNCPALSKLVRLLVSVRFPIKRLDKTNRFEQLVDRDRKTDDSIENIDRTLNPESFDVIRV